MIRIFLLPLILITAYQANCQFRLKPNCSKVTITIRVRNSLVDTMKLRFGNCFNDNVVLVVLKNGFFTFSGTINRASEGMIFTDIKNRVEVDGPTVIRFIIEPGNMNVSFSMEHSVPENIQITGSKSQVEKEQWEKKYSSVFITEKKYRKELAGINKEYGNDTSATVQKNRAEIAARMEAIKDVRALMALNYIKENKNSFFSAFLLFKYFYLIKPDTVAAYFDLLSKRVAQSEFGILIAERIIRNSDNWQFIKKYTDSSFSEKWLRGRSIYNVELKDMSGNKIPFSKFKGKYLLIDFWATWCGPCRAISPPKLREAIDQTKDLPIEFVSVSVDYKTDINEWKKVAKEINYPGVNVFDEDFLLSSIFKVNGIPRYVILDTEGKIIEMDAYQSSVPLAELIRSLIKAREKQL